MGSCRAVSWSADLTQPIGPELPLFRSASIQHAAHSNAQQRYAPLCDDTESDAAIVYVTCCLVCRGTTKRGHKRRRAHTSHHRIVLPALVACTALPALSRDSSQRTATCSRQG